MSNQTIDTISKVEEDALNFLCRKINDWATAKGWNEGEDSIMRKSSDIALMHSELSECLEFVRRKGDPYCNECQQFCDESDTHCRDCDEPITMRAPHDDHVPALTGESAELADVLIRIFHYCGRRGINLGEAVRLKHEYNITRPYKHGKNL